MIDLDMHPQRVLYIPARAVRVRESAGSVLLEIPFQPMRHNGTFQPIAGEEASARTVDFRLSAYGDHTLRFSAAFSDEPVDEYSLMLSPQNAVGTAPLHVTEHAEDQVTDICDASGRVRVRLSLREPKTRRWSDLQRKADPMIQMAFYPDGNLQKPVVPASYDHFFPGKFESVPFGYVSDDGRVGGVLFSFQAKPQEHFYGTGERFTRLDLAGKTILFENTDSLGTASRKTYKNVPFYVSSEGYGMFVHSTAHMRMSFADISNRAVQGLVDDTRLDLFLIGGGSVKEVLLNYRKLTGFSPRLPAWSYGMWMSRMTYFSADEVEHIAARLRREEFPCDVIHLDSGYFSEDWICDWSFSPERFPDPAAFIRRLRKNGFHISVWQTPNIGKTNPLYAEAKEHGYLPEHLEESGVVTMSDFSGQDFGGQIDFTNDEATDWYKSLVSELLDLGVECIKTDFGEKIALNARFKHMPAERLHNFYAILYQKAAFEATSRYTDKPFIWGRASWAGGQRYPLHWGGDTSATWDGMASSLRGGLQFGLSGFTFWSHDIPGFHGLPEFMNTWPTETLYMRWTQFGVFTSHMRYHGTTPREPWEYPGIADGVRKWLRFRYALIPYILQEAKYCTGGSTGRPMVCPLLFDYDDDPAVWHIDDQYLFGRDLLVAPIMNDEGIRDIYLPQGNWTDLYSGTRVEGSRWLCKVFYPLSAIPVFVRTGAAIPYYPERVLSTDEMNPDKSERMVFDNTYSGLAASALGKLCGFSEDDFRAIEGV